MYSHLFSTHGRFSVPPIRTFINLPHALQQPSQEALFGNGWDRHLFALRKLAEGRGETPAIFEDKVRLLDMHAFVVYGRGPLLSTCLSIHLSFSSYYISIHLSFFLSLVHIYTYLLLFLHSTYICISFFFFIVHIYTSLFLSLLSTYLYISPSFSS